MHLTAYRNCEDFYRKYIGNLLNLKVADIGSYDVNGTLKPIFSKHFYTGIDQCAGPNVDLVSDAHKLELANKSFDVVVSTSCFEHDEMFWLTFLEMCRIVKEGGLIYINAPSTGCFHRYPVDCWRFYPDSWAALAKWANHNGYKMKLEESYTDQHCEFKNAVGIFRRL